MIKNRFNIVGAAKFFWQWWKTELFDLMPPQLQNLPIFLKNSAEIYVSESEIKLVRKSKNKFECLSIELPLNKGFDEELKEQLVGFLNNNKIVSVDVYLSKSLVFVDEFILKNTSGSSLKKIINLEIERRSPLQISRALSGIYIDKNHPHSEEQKINWGVTKHETITSILAAINQTGSTSIRIMTKTDDEKLIHFFVPHELISLQQIIKKIGVSQALVLSLILLSFINIFAFTGVQNEKIGQLTDRLALTTNQANDALLVLNEYRTLKNLKETTSNSSKIPSVGNVLNEISKILVDGIWITEFRMNIGSVQLSGFGKNPVQIAATLEKSNIFSDVRVVNSSTLNEGQTQFNLTLQINMEGANE